MYHRHRSGEGRHLRLLSAGAACVYNADTIKPGVAAEGVGLCPLPVSKLADISRNKVAQNTLAFGAGLSMMGIGFQALEEVLSEQFKKKGDAVVSEPVGIARAGYDYANANFRPFAWPLPITESRYGVLSAKHCHGHGRRSCGSEILLCLPNESFDQSSALDGGPRGAPSKVDEGRPGLCPGRTAEAAVAT